MDICHTMEILECPHSRTYFLLRYKALAIILSVHKGVFGAFQHWLLDTLLQTAQTLLSAPDWTNATFCCLLDLSVTLSYIKKTTEIFSCGHLRQQISHVVTKSFFILTGRQLVSIVL